MSFLCDVTKSISWLSPLMRIELMYIWTNKIVRFFIQGSADFGGYIWSLIKKERNICNEKDRNKAKDRKKLWMAEK